MIYIKSTKYVPEEFRQLTLYFSEKITYNTSLMFGPSLEEIFYVRPEDRDPAWEYEHMDKKGESIGSVIRYREHYSIYEPLTSLAIGNLVRRETKPTDTIVEIGAGNGELARMVGSDRTIIPTDISHGATILLRGNILGVSQPVIRMDYQHMAIQQADVLIGLSSFDTFKDLDPLFKEAKRILRPNEGKLLHIGGLKTCSTLLFQYCYENGKIPFPYVTQSSAMYDEASIYGSVYVVDASEVENKKDIPENLKAISSWYSHYPEVYYYEMLKQYGGHHEDFDQLSKLAQEANFATGRVVSFDDFYLERFYDAAHKNGFTVSKGTAVSEDTISSRGMEERRITELNDALHFHRGYKGWISEEAVRVDVVNGYASIQEFPGRKHQWGWVHTRVAVPYLEATISK